MGQSRNNIALFATFPLVIATLVLGLQVLNTSNASVIIQQIITTSGRKQTARFIVYRIFLHVLFFG